MNSLSPPSLDVLPAAVRGPSARRAAHLRRAMLRVGLRLRAIGPAIRRAVDIVVSGLALLAIAPLLAVAAVAIKLSSPGPIFFFQERIGQYGRRFKMVKLRTMVVNAEALKTQLAQKRAEASDGVRFKLRDDPRITGPGRLLRRFSVDEFPQFWNVFVGDMTLVGPRPPVWREVALYDPRALRRLEVRPGLTCLWQVGGRSDLDFDQQVSLDLEYIDSVKPIDEIKIVARTVPAVLTGKGAC
jgi:lipopolysaccharide/colanic/teichoic acid biosynthesis glycosyltransferase